VYFPPCGWLTCLPAPKVEGDAAGGAVPEESQAGFDLGGEGGAGAGTSGGQGGAGSGGGEGGAGTGGSGGGESPRSMGTGKEQIEKSMEGFDSGERAPGESAPSSFSEEDSSGGNKVLLLSLLAVVALMLLFLGGWALWVWWKKRRSRDRKAEEEVARGTSLARDQVRFIYLTYKKMCEELATVGLSRRKSETPDEYLARIRSAHPSATQFAAPISNALEDCLYGMRPIDRESLSKLDACLQYLRELCQGIRSSTQKEWK
jgi:hypothetical protein